MSKAAVIIPLVAVALGALLIVLMFNTLPKGTTPPLSGTPKTYECDADAKICPDGSSVGRTGEKCEFAACPSPDATSATLTTYLDGSPTALNVTLQPKKVVSDSRCPEGVQCIWAGTVEVRTVMSTQVAHGEQTLTLGTPVRFGDFMVTLSEVTPYPKAGETIPDSAYRFTFKLEKRSEDACPAGTARVGEGCMPLKDECELRGDQYYFDQAKGECLVMSESPQTMQVKIALLNTTGEGTGKSRGCDTVTMKSVSVPQSPAPLTAALVALFAAPEGTQPSTEYNFIARTKATLTFDKATITNGTANIYLTGKLSGLAGVCDDPRTAAQLEETALQFPTVQKVQIYLNGAPTTLTPSQQ